MNPLTARGESKPIGLRTVVLVVLMVGHFLVCCYRKRQGLIGLLPSVKEKTRPHPSGTTAWVIPRRQPLGRYPLAVLRFAQYACDVRRLRAAGIVLRRPGRRG